MMGMREWGDPFVVGLYTLLGDTREHDRSEKGTFGAWHAEMSSDDIEWISPSMVEDVIIFGSHVCACQWENNDTPSTSHKV